MTDIQWIKIIGESAIYVNSKYFCEDESVNFFFYPHLFILGSSAVTSLFVSSQPPLTYASDNLRLKILQLSFFLSFLYVFECLCNSRTIFEGYRADERDFNQRTRYTGEYS